MGGDASKPNGAPSNWRQMVSKGAGVVGNAAGTAYDAVASGRVGNALSQLGTGVGGLGAGTANLVDATKAAHSLVTKAYTGEGEGGTALSPQDREDLEAVVAKLQGILGAAGVDGGCECRGGFFGGAMEEEPSEGLASYAESASARLKESVVSGIGAALKAAGMAIDTSSPEQIVASIAAAVPDPRGKPLFSADREKQVKACKILAKVLNDQFTPGATRGSEKFVDDSGPPEEVCRQVGEWTHAFTLGVNTEFLAVHASVRNALEQVQVLLKLLEVARRRVRKGVEAREDAGLDQETRPAFELLEKTESEMKRLVAVLSNILHVNLGEAEDALKFARDDDGSGSRALRALIKRAGVAGSPGFAKGLGAAVAGLGGAADVAHRVHLALRAVGLSVSDFLGSRSFADLRREVHRRQEAGELPVAEATAPPSKGDPAALVTRALALIQDKLGDFREGADAAEYAAALRGDAPGPREVWAGGAGGAAGGADLADQLYGLREPKPYESRDERVKLEKKLLVRDFAKRMADRSAAVVTAVRALAPKLGAEIPLSDRTEALAEAVRRLPMSTATGKRMELALLGFGLDAAARSDKDAYLAALRAVSGACADLVESAGGRAFGELKTAVDELVKTLDFFADTVAKKYGAAEVAAGTAGVAGGAGEELDLAKELPDVSRAGLSLPEAVSGFQYAYFTARVKENLSRSSAELESYGKQYEDLLGRAVASKLQLLDADESKIDKSLAALAAVHDGAGVTVDGARYSAGIAAGAPANAFTASHCKVLMARNKTEFAAKRKFYKALQAMDLYMKAFTAGLAKDPAAVRDAVKLLDETQTIAKWFSDATGEFIWKAFEVLPSSDGVAAGGRGVNSDLRPDVSPATAGHLFDRTGPVAPDSIGTRLGCPLKGVHLAENGAALGPRSAQAAAKSIDSAIDAFQGLKNLVNTFARVGSSFGGKELKSSVFMSPAQIYAALTEFLKVSALSMCTVGLSVEAAPTIMAGGGAAGSMNQAAVNGLDLAHGEVPFADGATSFGADDRAVTAGALHFGMAKHAPTGGVPPAAAADPYENLQGNFTEEDGYFVMVVKSMAAKVLTTLGVYDMFIREHPHYELTPARMIMGGGDDGVPEVLEGAAELYCRLPRLAEFYSSVLKWGAADTSAATAKIALVPDLEGVFSGLIRQVFRRASRVDAGGDYSDTELAAMVKEINRIYEHFRASHPENTAREVFAAFVLEVNRRYGVVRKDEKDAYWKLVEDGRMLAQTYADEAETDYAILPGEGDMEPTRAAPSDRYFAPAAAESAASARSLRLDPDHVVMIKDFRSKLDDAFASVGSTSSAGASYSLLVRQAAAEMRRLRSPEERFAVAARLIQSTSVSGVDSTKAMMFHETVMLGLNTLSVHQQMLSTLQARIESMDPVAIERYLRRKMAGFTVANNAVGNNASGDADAAAGAVGTNAMGANAAALGLGANAKYARYIHLDDGGAPNMAEFVLGRSGAGVLGANERHTAALTYALVYARLPTLMPVVAGMTPVQADYSIDQVRTIAAGVVRTWCEGQHLAARLLTNYEQIMVDFLEHVFAVTGPLVEARFSPEGGIRLSFSKLRNELERIMAVVRRYYEQFRPYLADSVVARFENVDAPGSLAWVNRNLFDKFLLDKSSSEESGLEKLSRQVQTVFANLIRDTKVTFGGITQAGDAGSITIVGDPPAGDLSRREWFGNAFARLTHYDASIKNVDAGAGAFDPYSHVLAPAGIDTPVTSAALGADGIAYLVGTATTRAVPPAAGAVVPRPQVAGANVGIFPLYQVGVGEGASTYRSLLFSYNQLVARFLATFSDGSGEGQKIYLNLINAFANGVVGMSIQDPARNAFPDLAAVATTFGARGDPKPTALLFQSLALILQRMVRDIGRTGAASYTEPSLTEVPIYMKESMRANLPGFVKLFDMLARKCDFVKRAFQQTGEISLARPAQLIAIQRTLRIRDVAGNAIAIPGAAPGVPAADATTIVVCSNAANSFYIHTPTIADGIFVTNSYSALTPLTAAMTPSTEMKARLAAIIDAIVGGCATLATSAAECLKELGDAPVFLQTGDGFIEQYRARNGGDSPLMPLSLAFRMLRMPITRGVAADQWRGLPAARLSADVDLWPRHMMGTAEFKLAYGCRQLLAAGTPVGFEQLPGVKAMLDAYNGVTTRREQIEEAEYLGFVQSVVAALRQAVDTRRYRAALSPVEIAPAVADPFDQATAVVQGGRSATAVFALDAEAAPDTQAVVTFVESTDQEGNRKKIADQVGGTSGASGTGGRTQELYANLIDLNIMPINLHALMRGIPLANLYNYAYTFDQYIASMYGKQATRVAVSPPTDTTTMFLQLLMDPFRQVSWEEYGSDTHSMGSGGFVHRMFRGDNGLGMGRPKFLSDQLANKALYISIYQDAADLDEGGPAVGIGRARGDTSGSQLLRAWNELIGPIAREMAAIRAVDQTFNAAAAAARNTMAGGNLLATQVEGYRAWIRRCIAVLQRTVAAARVGATAAAKYFGRLMSEQREAPGALGGPLGVAAVTADQAFVQTHVSTNANGDIPAHCGTRADGLVPITTELAIAIHAGSSDGGAGFAEQSDYPLSAAWWNALATLAAAQVGPISNELTIAAGAVTANAAVNALLQHFDSASVRTAAGGWGGWGGALAAQSLFSAGGAPGMTIRLYFECLQRPDVAPRPYGSIFRAVLAKASEDAAPTSRTGATAARQVGPRATKISYLKAAGDDLHSPARMTRSEVVEVPVPFDVKMKLESLGKLRFDTRFIRKLVFITNTGRLLRLKLQRELLEERRAVVGSIRTLAPGVTEYGQDPFGANDVYESQTYAGEPRFPSTRSGF
jgi:hypothetical protein